VRFKQMLNSRRATLLIAAILLVGATSGTTFAAQLITSADIKDKTIQRKDLKNHIVNTDKLKTGGVQYGDLSDGAKDKLKGKTGPAGPVGPAGPSGVIATSTAITAPNAAYGGLNVVAVPASPALGQNDSRTPLVSVVLNRGTYHLTATAQFFHFPAGAAAVDYGVVSTNVNGQPQPGTGWTSDIPNDGSNAGQTTVASIVTISADNTTVTLVGSIRGATAGQAGAQVLVMKVR
jgi:hypothetical protein